jgi:hypothetical protein
MNKQTRIRLIVYAIVFALLVVLLVFWSFLNTARGRDYQRLADMRILESSFNSYFFAFNSYEVPDCVAGSVVNFCTGRGDNILDVSGLMDPVSTGSMRYVVSEISQSSFRVEFILETSLAGLDKGVYALTPAGLGK